GGSEVALTVTPVAPAALEDVPNRAPAQVFVGYSRKDRAWFKRLSRALGRVVDAERVEAWDGSQVKGGRPWRAEYERAVEGARGAVLLVSIDYFVSEFVLDEELPVLLHRARQGEIALLPVVVGWCTNMWEKSGLAEFQAVNSPMSPLVDKSRAEQDKTFSNVALLVERYLRD